MLHIKDFPINVLNVGHAEIDKFASIAPYIGIVFLLIAVVFIWRSFYSMRIKSTTDDTAAEDK